MTAGTQISWKGDFANAPKSGVIASVANGNLRVKWNDGSEMLVPDFTVKPHYGWTVGNA